MNIVLKPKSKKKLLSKIVALLIMMPVIAQAQNMPANPAQATIVKAGLNNRVLAKGKFKPKEQAKHNVKIYPNPANDWVEIEPFQNKPDGQLLEIFNGQGSRMLSQKWDGQKIDVSQFPTGIYIVTLKRKQEVYSQKLVVSR